MSNPKLVRTQLKGKKVLVLGMARSGQAAARLILHLGGSVVLYDRKPLSDLNINQELLTHSMVKSSFGSTDLPDDVFDFAVFSPGIPYDSLLLNQVRQKNIPLIGELEFASLYIPCPYAAVSGTNGKTTTVSLLGYMLECEGFHTKVAGNVGYPLSDAVLDLSSAARLVVEVSSFQLESTDTFHPNCAAILNITPDHLDRHGSMDNYISLKKHLFDAMNEDDLVVLNADDRHCFSMVPALDTTIQLFSTNHPVHNGAYSQSGIIYLSQNGRHKKLVDRDVIFLPGDHNTENALAAILLAKCLGVSEQKIVKALKEFKGVEHRIELVSTPGSIRYYNDSKGTNPESTMKAVNAMVGPFVLIAGGYDKKTSFDELAALTVSLPNFIGLVVLGDTAHKIASSFENAGVRVIRFADNLESAIALAKEMCPHEGNILYSPACSSFDMFKDYEERGRIFKQLVCIQESHV